VDVRRDGSTTAHTLPDFGAADYFDLVITIRIEWPALQVSSDLAVLDTLTVKAGRLSSPHDTCRLNNVILTAASLPPDTLNIVGDWTRRAGLRPNTARSTLIATTDQP